MTTKHPGEDEVLETAVQALRQTAAASSPPEELLNRIAAAGPTTVDDRPALWGLVTSRRFLRPLLRVAAAAVLLLVVWQTAAYLLHPTPAFADVVQRLQQTHSVFFRYTMTVDGKKAAVMTYTLAEPGFLRIHASAPANTIITFDDSRSEGLLLLCDQKKAIKLTTAPDVPKETNSVIAWYRSLRQAQDHSVRDLGPRQIGDRPTFGFRVRKKQEQDLETGTAYDVWVDRKTSLPLRAEADLTVNGFEAHIVLDEFAFDAKVPATLFSLTPPEGYTVTAETELKMPAEGDLVRFLRKTAELNDGRFPDDLEFKTVQQILDKSPKTKALPGSADFNEVMQLTNGLLFMHLRLKDSDWRYLGRGLKLGDAAHVVCAWRRKGESEFRTVFGDLQIRNVPEARLTAKQPE